MPTRTDLFIVVLVTFKRRKIAANKWFLHASIPRSYRFFPPLTTTTGHAIAILVTLMCHRNVTNYLRFYRLHGAPFCWRSRRKRWLVRWQVYESRVFRFRNSNCSSWPEGSHVMCAFTKTEPCLPEVCFAAGYTLLLLLLDDVCVLET